MIVVSDTSPLNYLIRLSAIDLLQEFYSRILVPPSVLRELEYDAAPTEVRSWIANRPFWLQERPAKQIDESLPAVLGDGEREAISIALESGSDLLLIDERAGRHAARARGIAVAGTLAVLLKASLVGRLELPGSLARLRQFGFRLSRAVEEEMLKRLAEGR